MRLTKYPDVETIRETKTIRLTNQNGKPIELEIQDLPPTYGDDMQAVLPTPKPAVLGPLKDKGKVQFHDSGKPILRYDDDDEVYLKKKAQSDTLQLVYMVIHGVAAGQLTFDTQADPSDTTAFFRGVLAEMKDFGFGMGQVTRIARAVQELSGITDEDVKKAKAGFSQEAS